MARIAAHLVKASLIPSLSYPEIFYRLQYEKYEASQGILQRVVSTLDSGRHITGRVFL